MQADKTPPSTIAGRAAIADNCIIMDAQSVRLAKNTIVQPVVCTAGAEPPYIPHHSQNHL